MKKIFLLLTAACLSVVVSAQKVYFIYLQTEDQSPFYVRMADKIYSSAAAGYLILPNLVDTTYYLHVGFAKSAEPEAKFSVAINQNDRGFLIKKFDEGLALFDFEELSVVKANAQPKDNTVYETKTDAFSNILSKAAGDPSIVKVPVAKKEETVKPQPEPEKKDEVLVKNEEVKPAEKPMAEMNSVQPDTAVATKIVAEEKAAKAETVAATFVTPDTTARQQTTTAVQPDTAATAINQPTSVENTVVKEETPPQLPAFKPSVVTRRSESSTTEGFGLVYFDKDRENTDTIRILIPASKVKLVAETEVSSAVETPPAREKVDPVVEAKKPEAEKVEAEKPVTENPPVAKGESKAACTNSASDKDFMKLRKKMAAKENDDEMITEAKKEFRNKCYTVEQIRNLSALFLTSAAKYQFFDVAYQHVSDRSNFASLAAEIRDEYYLKRFKALIGE